MPDALLDVQPLGTLFRLGTKPVFPALEPTREFHHHSLPAWDATRRPAIEPGSSIESNKVLLDEPAVLVSKLNPRKPRVTVVRPQAGERHCASTEFMCFVPRKPDEVLSYWAYYLESSNFSTRLQRVAVGSTNSHTRASPSEVIRWTVPNPPSPQKHAIAKILDALDTTIRQTEAIIEKLKLVKQGLLHDLLTRGIGANGELRPPQSQAPHLYKDSPLGWIPLQWSVEPTSTRCSLITKGTTPAANDMWQGDDGIRFLRVDNLSFDGQFDFGASKFRVASVTHAGTLARSRCLPGDVLTNIVGPPLGKLGLVTEQSDEININQAIALFRPMEQLLPRFLLIWLGSSISQSWLRQRAKQTSGQVNLTLALCQELPLPCMTVNEQQAIVDRIDAAQERVTIEAIELTKLNELKSGLMDDLLTGRVRVTPLLASARRNSHKGSIP